MELVDVPQNMAGRRQLQIFGLVDGEYEAGVRKALAMLRDEVIDNQGIVGQDSGLDLRRNVFHSLIRINTPNSSRELGGISSRSCSSVRNTLANGGCSASAWCVAED